MLIFSKLTAHNDKSSTILYNIAIDPNITIDWLP
jgi:hypothetical protein